MKIAVMQPYLFPYLGYWQLLEAVDLFVLLDDVNYIRRGWINRNRYLCDGNIQYFTLPVEKASQNRLIQDIHLHYDPKQRQNLLRTFQYAYRGYPFQQQTLPLLEQVFLNPQTDLVQFVQHTMELVKPRLGIQTPICRASEMRGKPHAKGQDGILELCRIAGADIYINAIGGRELYCRDAFQAQGIALHFLQTQSDQALCLTQGQPWDLSVVDLLMRFPPDLLRCLLDQYTLC